MGTVIFAEKIIRRMTSTLDDLFLSDKIVVLLVGKETLKNWNEGTDQRMKNIKTLEWKDVAAESRELKPLRIKEGAIYCEQTEFHIVDARISIAGFNFYKKNGGDFLWHTPKPLVLLGNSGDFVTVNFPMPVAYLNSILTVEV